MSEAHTKGPWQVLPPENDKPYLRIRGTRLGGRYKIANVIAQCYEGEHEREAFETEANARLITAAPDLLEALIEMTRHFTKTPSSLKDSEMRGKAHAAIAKAQPAAKGV
jgi:hypothetical protein